MERIQRRMEIDPVRGCWLWLGPLTADKYARMGSSRGGVKGHRALWIELHGPLDRREYVLHRCDVPRCCNPDHLYVGTQQDNMRDRNVRGRQARGEKQGFARLTAAAVLAIRSDPRENRLIAADYGLDRSWVSRLKNRKFWTHIQEETTD